MICRHRTVVTSALMSALLLAALAGGVPSASAQNADGAGLPPALENSASTETQAGAAPVTGEGGQLIDGASPAPNQPADPTPDASAAAPVAEKIILEPPPSADIDESKEPALPDGTGHSATAPLILGGVILAVLVAGIVLFNLVKRFAERTKDKYGYNVFLNGWNVVNLAAVLIAGISPAFGVDAFKVGLTVAAGLWVLVLMINIKKTSIGTGFIISLVQPMFVAVAWVAYGVAKSAGRRRY